MRGKHFVVLAVVAAVVVGVFFFVMQEDVIDPSGVDKPVPVSLEPVVPDTQSVETSTELADAEPPREVVEPQTPVLERAAYDAPKVPEHGPGTIYGKVVSAKGASLEGVTVSVVIEEMDGVKHQSTSPFANQPLDAEHKFEFKDLPLGSYVARAASADAVGYYSVKLVAARLDREITLTIRPAAAISGVVMNALGNPVEGAKVYPSSKRIVGKGGKSRDAVDTKAIAGLLMCVSDAEGRFQIDSLEIASGSKTMTFRLFAKAEKYGSGLSDYYSVGTNDAMIMLSPDGSASGTTVNAETGEPFPGVKVKVGESMTVQETTSDGDGRFKFASLVAGDYTIAVLGDHVKIGDKQQFTVFSGEDTGGLVLKVRAGATIAGRAYDSDTEAPLAGLTVHAYGEATKTRKEATTRADGSFVVAGLSEDTYTVRRGEIPGYPPSHRDTPRERQATVEFGKDVTGLDFALSAGLAVKGWVVDDSGSPVTKARVYVRSQRGSVYESAQAKKDGSFEVNGLDPSNDLYASASTDGLSCEPVGPLSLIDGSVEDVTLVMRAAATIEGVVVDGYGNPVKEAVVWARPNARSYAFGGGTEKAGSDGTFKCDGLTAGAWRVTPYPPNTNSFSSNAEHELVEVADGEHVTGIRLVLDEAEGLSISGTVTDDSGKPVQRAYLNASGRMTHVSAETDKEGKYELKGLKEGEYYINVHHYKHSEIQLRGVAAGSENVDFVLAGHGKIEGQVVDTRTREPLTDFQVYAYKGDRAKVEPWMNDNFKGVHDEAGKFLLDDVNEGDATVFARADGYATSLVYIENVVADETVSGVVIELTPGDAVDGIVVNAGGEPVKNASIFLGKIPDYNRGQSAVAHSNAEGKFTLKSLAVGTSIISAWHPDYAPASVNADPAIDREIRIVLDQGGAVEGWITVGGRPSADAYINVHIGSGAQRNSQHTAVDAKGYFKISGLSAGSGSVSAGIGQDSSRRHKSVQIDVVNGQTVQVEIEFSSATASLEGYVFKEGNVPVEAYLNVMVGTGGAMESFNTQTNSEGFYKFDTVPAGSITLRASTKEGMMRSAALDIREGEAARYDIDIDAGVAVVCELRNLPVEFVMVAVVALRGKVTIPDRMDMVAFQQTMSQPAAMGFNKDGSPVRLTGLDPGTYTLFAYCMSRQPTSPEDAEEAFANMATATTVIDVPENQKQVEVTLQF